MMNYIQPDVLQVVGGATLTSGTLTVIVTATQTLRARNQAAYVLNQSGFTLSGVLLQLNPDPAAVPNDALWFTVDSETSVPSGTLVQLTSTTPAKWSRVVALARHGSQTASGYFYASSI